MPTQLPLPIGNRNQRDVRKRRVEGLQVGQVEAPVKRRHGTFSNVADEREVPLFDMEMQDVELISTATDLIEHDDMIGDMVLDLGI